MTTEPAEQVTKKPGCFRRFWKSLRKWCCCRGEDETKEEPRGSTQPLLNKTSVVSTQSQQIATTTRISEQTESEPNTTNNEAENKITHETETPNQEADEDKEANTIVGGDNQESPTETKILDLQEHFEDFDPNALDLKKESFEYLKAIEDRARSFEEKVRDFSGTNYSVSYFVVDENLTRLVEYLDQVKLQDNPALLTEKIRIINYIKNLQSELDANVKEK